MRVEIEGGHPPRPSLVNVDRPLVGAVVARVVVHRPDHPAGDLLDDPHGVAAGAPQVGEGAGAVRPGPEPAARAPSQGATCREGVEEVAGVGTEQFEVGLGDGQLGGRRAQVGRQYVGVGRVEHGRLDVLPEDRLRMVHQEGIQGIVTSHEDGERLAAAAARPPRLLPQRRPPPGPAAHEHRVQAGDVDPELEGVRAGEPQQPSFAQFRLRARPLLGQVTAAVGGDPLAQLRIHLLQEPPGPAATASAPRRDGTKARLRVPVTTRSASSSAASATAVRRVGAPFSPPPAVSGGSHNATWVPPRGDASCVTTRTSSPVSARAVPPGSPVVADASTKVGSLR